MEDKFSLSFSLLSISDSKMKGLPFNLQFVPSHTQQCRGETEGAVVLPTCLSEFYSAAEK